MQVSWLPDVYDTNCHSVTVHDNLSRTITSGTTIPRAQRCSTSMPSVSSAIWSWCTQTSVLVYARINDRSSGCRSLCWRTRSIITVSDASSSRPTSQWKASRRMARYTIIRSHPQGHRPQNRPQNTRRLPSSPLSNARRTLTRTLRPSRLRLSPGHPHARGRPRQ